MKRLSALILVICLSLLCCACKNPTESEGGSDSPNSRSDSSELSALSAESGSELSTVSDEPFSEPSIESTEEPSDEPSEEPSAESAESGSSPDESPPSGISDVPPEESSDESSEEPYIEPSDEPVSVLTGRIAATGKALRATNIEDAAALALIDELCEYLEGKGFGVCYTDASFEYYFSYNCAEIFPTASTVKLPYMRYLLGLADSGEIDLGEELTYTKDYYNGGSGRIKNMDEGRIFTVKKLIEYAVKYSDNIAYSMLIGRYGVSGFNRSVEALDVNLRISSNGYGNCSACDMAALYFDFYHYEGENKAFLKDVLLNTSYNRQIGKGISEYPVAQKFGCQMGANANLAYHDVAIVYAPRPFVLCVFTRLDYNSSGKDAPFIYIAKKINELNSLLAN